MSGFIFIVSFYSYKVYKVSNKKCNVRFYFQVEVIIR